MCKNSTPKDFLRKHISFHHMTQEEDVVEKIYKMHFPSKEIECQTSLSWVSTMVNLDETIEKIEDNLETFADNNTNVYDIPAEAINNEYAEEVISRTFNYGVIVNETDTSEAIEHCHQNRMRGKLRGPKCVRRKNGTVDSSDEDEAVGTAAGHLQCGDGRAHGFVPNGWRLPVLSECGV